MYVEEIKAERKGRVYRTYLVRESYREGSKVNHRTLANISNLPLGCIQEIKKYLKGRAGGLDLTKLRLSQSKEYGASQTLLSFAKRLRFDYAIHPKKAFWREEALGFVLSRLIYPGHSLFQAKKNPDTMLWQLCHSSDIGVDDDLSSLQNTLDALMENRPSIQKRLAKKHARSKAVFCYVMQEDVYQPLGDISIAGHVFDHSLRIEPMMTALWTNDEGCPWAIEKFRRSNEEGLCFQEDIQKLLKSTQTKRVIFVGDGQALNEPPIKIAKNEGYDTIISLGQLQLRRFVESQPLFFEFLSSGETREVVDPQNPSYRYILCFGGARNKNQSHDALTHDFTTLKDIRRVHLGGFYVLHTDIPKEAMSAEEIIAAYRKLSLIKLFKFATDNLIDPDPQVCGRNDGVELHLFMSMLSYYLYWQMEKRLQTMVNADEKGLQAPLKGWEAIEKLKGIRCQTVQIDNIVLKEVKNTLDEEQEKIISCLEA